MDYMVPMAEVHCIDNLSEVVECLILLHQEALASTFLEPVRDETCHAASSDEFHYNAKMVREQDYFLRSHDVEVALSQL